LIRNHKRGFRCEPGTFRNAAPRPRREYAKFFGENGLRLVQRADWPTLTINSEV
jgi:hypothetical protein